MQMNLDRYTIAFKLRFFKVKIIMIFGQVGYNQQEFSFFNNKVNQLALENQAATVARELKNHLNERLEVP